MTSFLSYLTRSVSWSVMFQNSRVAKSSRVEFDNAKYSTWCTVKSMTVSGVERASVAPESETVATKCFARRLFFEAKKKRSLFRISRTVDPLATPFDVCLVCNNAAPPTHHANNTSWCETNVNDTTHHSSQFALCSLSYASLRTFPLFENNFRGELLPMLLA